MPCKYKTNNGEHTCQFNESENALIQLEDSTQWCKYHCPMTITINEETKETQKSNWSIEEMVKFNESIILHIKEGVSNKTKTNLAGIVFTGSINFDKQEMYFCDFTNATFSDDAVFNQTTFGGESSFINTIFNKQVYFSNTIFGGHVYFNQATFRGAAIFSQSTFNRQAVFKDTLFSGSATFDGSTFGSGTWFNKSAFCRGASFNNTTFSRDDTWFKEAAFNGDAWFYNAAFSGDVWFSNTTFSSDAGFSGAIFSRDARFNKVKFNGDAWFRETKFGGNAEFSEATFSGAAEFRDGYQSNNYFSWASFSCATFDGECTFNNRIFTYTTIFSDCIFNLSPSFHNCELHQDTDFDGAQFEDTRSKSAARNYRTLKLAMEKHRATDEQSAFYALEQKSLRNQTKTPDWVKLTSFLYEVTSNYGQSALKPLVGLAVVIISFWLTFTAILDFKYFQHSLVSSADILQFTIQQIVFPFSVWAEKSADTLNKLFGEEKLFVQLLASIQSILGLTFIALFLLAVRWKFKRGQ